MALTKKQRELCAKILDEVYTNGAISRIDIANKTNITPATVSSLTSQMVEEGLLYEAGETFDKKNKAGRKRSCFRSAMIIAISLVPRFQNGITLLV